MGVRFVSSGPFSSIEEALVDIRSGHMVVVRDAEAGENEGDLTMAAQFATPEAINFMAREGRGLICLALTPERCQELGLELMAAKSGWVELAFPLSSTCIPGLPPGSNRWQSTPRLRFGPGETWTSGSEPGSSPATKPPMNERYFHG
jgi:hypothetical protein